MVFHRILELHGEGCLSHPIFLCKLYLYNSLKLYFINPNYIVKKSKNEILYL